LWCSIFYAGLAFKDKPEAFQNEEFLYHKEVRRIGPDQLSVSSGGNHFKTFALFCQKPFYNTLTHAGCAVNNTRPDA